MFNNFENLIDKKITSITFNPTQITFNFENGRAVYIAEGGCCSSSYIEDLDNPSIFENAILISVEDVSGGSKDFDNGMGVHKWTFFKFKTDKGMCTLSFRNESNGYYDGWLQLQN